MVLLAGVIVCVVVGIVAGGGDWPESLDVIWQFS